MGNKRDDFSPSIINILRKRASYNCSNPDCRASTIAPSEEHNEKIIYIGKAAHITAASVGGPRYDISLSSEKRSSIENAIFLCSNCADMIDKNNGIDFSVKLLKEWKNIHESWVRENLNNSHLVKNNEVDPNKKKEQFYLNVENFEFTKDFDHFLTKATLINNGYSIVTISDIHLILSRPHQSNQGSILYSILKYSILIKSNTEIISEIIFGDKDSITLSLSEFDGLPFDISMVELNLPAVGGF